MNIIVGMEIELTSEGRARFGKITDLRHVQSETVVEESTETMEQFPRVRRLLAPLQGLVEKIMVVDDASSSHMR